MADAEGDVCPSQPGPQMEGGLSPSVLECPAGP